MIRGTLDMLQVNQGSLYASLHRLPHQCWTKSEAAGTLLGAGILAALVPALRSSSTHPAVALRAE